MKLSDVMSSMNLAAYAEAGLVIFMLVFVAVVVELLRRGPAVERLARLPLDATDVESAREGRHE